MVRAMLYDSKSGDVVSGDERLIEDWKGNPDKLIWVDLFEVPPDEERLLLENDFKLHRLAVQDAMRDRHPPKLERFDDYLFLIIDGYLALASHRLNKVMQVLTIFTVIFVPLSFLAGIYGMNFEYIPELGFKYSYFILLGVMVTIVIIQLMLFRRKKWL